MMAVILRIVLEDSEWDSISIILITQLSQELLITACGPWRINSAARGYLLILIWRMPLPQITLLEAETHISMQVFSEWLITFHYQGPCAARSSKRVRGHTGVTPSIWFSHVDDSEGPIFGNGNSEIKAEKPRMVSLPAVTNWKWVMSPLQHMS